MKKLRLLCAIVLIVQGLSAQTTKTAKLVIPIGHTSGVNAVDISPDSRFYLTGSLDYTVKIWDKGGDEMRTLAGHTKNVRAVSFSPISKEDPVGGKYILSGSNDNTAILWDFLGVQLGKFTEPGDQGEITSVAFSPIGREMVVGSKSGNAWLLDDTCKGILKFQHKKEVSSVAFSPNGDFILTGCKDKTALLWKRKDASRPVRIFSGHTEAVLSAVFSKTGDTILTGSADGTAILWKLTGEKIRTFQHAGELRSVAISPDGQKIITGNAEGTIKVWNLADKESKSMKLYDRELRTLKISADGQQMLSGSSVHPAAKVSKLDGSIIHTLKGHTNGITALALSPDGASLLVAHEDSTAKLWDLSARTVQSFSYPERLVSVAFSPKYAEKSKSGKIFITGCEDRICRVQDYKGKEKMQFKSAKRAVFSADGNFVLTGNSDGITQYWDLATNKVLPLPNTLRDITALAISPTEGSKAFAIGSNDGRVVYWDSVAAKPVTFSLSMPMSVKAIAFAPDGKTMAFGESGGFTEIRDLSGTLVKEYPNRKRGIKDVRTLAFSLPTDKDKKGGKFVLRAAGNNVERWDIAKAQIDTFSGHTSVVTALVHSPEGNLIYTGSKDGTVKIWDALSGKTLVTLVSIDSADWAVTTPRGLYDASPSAMKLMHYVAGTDVISIDQIKDRYYEPGLLAKVAGFNEDTIRNVTMIDTLSLFPEVTMKIVGNKLKITLKERNGGIGKLSLYVDHSRMIENINPDKLTDLPLIDLDTFRKKFRTDIPNKIGLVSFNKENELGSQRYELLYAYVGARGDGNDNARNNCETAEPNIFLVVVGTSKYRNSAINLAFPDQDAAAMADALYGVANVMRPGHVFLKHLSTSGKDGVTLATKANIKAAFDEFAELASPCDVLVAYFSGHGKNWALENGKRAKFYYLTQGISAGELSDKGLRDAHAISDGELEEYLNNVPAQKQVLILDACHSGQANANIKLKGAAEGKDLNTNQQIALELLNGRTGAWILSGSMADMRSWEASKYGQGLLTYSLLDGMSGAAVIAGNHVDVSSLFSHARNQVPDLAESIGQTQTPVQLGEGATFPIGIKNETVMIKLPQAKDVFTQSEFISEECIDDTLKLGEALNDYFFEQRLKGKAARYVYYSSTIPLDNGFRVKGIYSVKGDKVIVGGNLFLGTKPFGYRFSVEGGKDTKDLVDKIIREIEPRIPKRD